MTAATHLRRRFRDATLGAAFVAALAVLVVASTPTVSVAGEYEGTGDTGWTENNTRDCCADAVALAQNNSAGMCLTAGRHPKVNRGASRGQCDWDAHGDADDVVYRCTATATVACW